MSEEWGELSPERLGRVTASRIKDVVATVKSGGYGASRERYRTQLVVERLTGVMAPSYENAAMRWGKENEPLARAAYEFNLGADVTFAGFVIHPRITMAGASPDGFVGDEGMAEFKCPESPTHVATMLGTKIDAGYVAQCQWQLACADRTWVDWCSFDPRLPEKMRLFVQRIYRDDKMIQELEREVILFLSEVDAIVDALKRKYAMDAAA